MSNIRTSKHITNKDDIEYLLNITEDKVASSFIIETFGEFKGKRRFNPYDTIYIPPGYYGPEGNKNTNTFTTTVGLWVFNKYFVERELFDILGYIDEPITDDKFKDIHQTLIYAITEDDIKLEVFKRFLMKTQFTMQHVSVLSPSYTLKMLTCTKAINKKKEELKKKYADAIKNGDEKAIDDMESELKSFAKEYMKDDPSMDSFNSGARGSFGNNFKNMFIMKGASKDPDPHKGYDIMTSNYMDGIAQEEYHKFANTLAAGPYARAKKTEKGGYWEKLFVSAFQHIILDPPNSDCKTKRYIEAEITKKNIGLYMYSYVIQGNNLIEITSKNKNSFIGKKVKIRFSSMCESKTGLCNKCAGNLFYRLGIKNVGMSTPIAPSTLKNLSMKSFHMSIIQFVEMNPMEAFGLK